MVWAVSIISMREACGFAHYFCSNTYNEMPICAVDIILCRFESAEYRYSVQIGLGLLQR